MVDVTQISALSVDFHSKRLEAAVENLAKDGLIVSGKATKSVVSIKQNFDHLIEAVSVSDVAALTKRVEKPESPHADSEGYVTVYDMNQSELVTDALEAYRMYESNIRALGLYNKMVSKSYEIGK